MFLFIESHVYVQLTFCPDDLCLSGPHIVNCVHHFSSLVIFIPIRNVLIILNLCLYSLGLSVTLPVCTRVVNHSFLFLCVCVPVNSGITRYIVSFLSHADSVLLSRNHTLTHNLYSSFICHSYLITKYTTPYNSQVYNFLQVPISRNKELVAN